VLLIAAGVGVLLEAVPRRERTPEPEAIELPLDGARAGRIRIEHGAGRLRIGPSAPEGMLVVGTTVGPAEQDSRRTGDELDVRLRRSWRMGRSRYGPADWRLGLSTEVPLSLELRTGAGESLVDLSGLKLTELVVRTGATNTEITLPEKGRVSASVSAGAAKVVICVPAAVAARIRQRTGIAGFDVDTSRFPRSEGGHESPGFDRAEDRVDLDIEGGAAGFEIR
jgi:hypothetical protein